MEEIKQNVSDKAKQDFLLVEQAISGEQQAFAKLLNKYKDAIYFMTLKMVNNQNDAEDLTLEAFGKAFRNLHQYSTEYAFSTWLFKIASNNCVDFLRKKKGIYVPLDAKMKNGQEPQESSMKFKTNAPDPEEKMIRKQTAIILRTVVRKLKPRYRTLVELRYFKEYSYEEIAKELELPLGTVKAQLFRAREKLYDLIEGSEMHS